MEETLTDCLVRVREDLSQLKKVRDYLDTNAETEEHCYVTWRTIEAFNSILSVCSSQNTPETNALDTLLDSFYYLARNNGDDKVWDDFGFELGIICVKVLSAIERSELFEMLFCKLLSVISIICEHNSNVWKAAARQILNVLINKKFSLPYLEAIVKLYICILKNIDSSALREFSSQNLLLLRTLSLLVQKVGDFEIQSNVVELVFLHLSKEKKLMSDFFSTTETKLFQSLQFTDFEQDCRLYLNEVNKQRRGFERKVYSICCQVLHLGGCFVEPPLGKNSLWVDANKDTERVSIKCGDETGDRTILVQFSDILKVHLEKEKTQNRVTIQTKNLAGLYNDARNDDICFASENRDDVVEFVRFLETTIGERKTKKKLKGRGSKTVTCLLFQGRLEVQDNAINTSERPGIDHSLPDVLSLFQKANQTTRETPPKNQQLSPNSFVESLNKHIGLGSPEQRHTFEDSIETVEFLQRNTPPAHKLFRSPDKIFHILEKTEPDFSFTFGENKENVADGKFKRSVKTYSRKSINVQLRTDESRIILRDKKNTEMNITNTQSQDYFRTGPKVLEKKKPCLPKLKRNTKTTKHVKDTTDNSKTPPQTEINANQIEDPKEEQKCVQNQPEPSENQLERQNQFRLELEVKEKKNPTDKSFRKQQRKQNKPMAESSKKAGKTDPNVKPSLLDPNGYAYQRWCKPTTSERSNFWLKKLNAMEKPRMDSDSVFDFSEDSESIFGKRSNKKRVVRSKPKNRTNATSLRQMKEILKKSPPKGKPKIEKKRIPAVLPQRAAPPVTGFSRSASPDSTNEQPGNSEYESLSGEDEIEAPTTKHERSESYGSGKSRTKKKSKTALPKNLLSTLRDRLRKTEEKDRQRTDEIIEAVYKASNRLFNYHQRKDGEGALSYLKTAEEASGEFDSQIDDLSLRLKRTQRAILYYKAGCSLGDFCESFSDQLSKVREALKIFQEKKDTSRTIDRIHVRLSDLIKSEIERSIEGEWASKRSQLLRCASVLGVDFRDFR